MEQHERLITEFYTAFARRDPVGMAACYHADVAFSDPVFVDLRGDRAGAMWEMLCLRGKDLKVEFRDVQADEQKGKAHWDAWYTFSATGRTVRNSIDATFEFADGMIIKHNDSFAFRAWASQALGLPGKLFGGFPFLQNKVRATALKGLDDHIARRG